MQWKKERANLNKTHHQNVIFCLFIFHCISVCSHFRELLSPNRICFQILSNSMGLGVNHYPYMVKIFLFPLVCCVCLHFIFMPPTSHVNYPRTSIRVSPVTEFKLSSHVSLYTSHQFLKVQKAGIIPNFFLQIFLKTKVAFCKTLKKSGSSCH